jgi:hypothetical protein
MSGITALGIGYVVMVLILAPTFALMVWSNPDTRKDGSTAVAGLCFVLALFWPIAFPIILIAVMLERTNRKE